MIVPEYGTPTVVVIAGKAVKLGVGANGAGAIAITPATTPVMLEGNFVEFTLFVAFTDNDILPDVDGVPVILTIKLAPETVVE